MTTSQQIMCLEYRIHCLREFVKLMDSLLDLARKSNEDVGCSVEEVLGEELWDCIWESFQSTLESRQD